MAAFDLGRRDSVVVLVKSGSDEDWNALPDQVKKDSRDSRVGKYIPYAIVYDAKLTSPLAFLTYEELKSGDARKAYREAHKALEEARAQTSSPGGSATGAEAGSEGTGPMETWTSLQGNTLVARARRLDGDTLTLIKENGSSVTVKLSQLDEASRQRAQERFATAAPPAP